MKILNVDSLKQSKILNDFFIYSRIGNGSVLKLKKKTTTGIPQPGAKKSIPAPSTGMKQPQTKLQKPKQNKLQKPSTIGAKKVLQTGNNRIKSYNVASNNNNNKDVGKSRLSYNSLPRPKTTGLIRRGETPTRSANRASLHSAMENKTNVPSYSQVKQNNFKSSGLMQPRTNLSSPASYDCIAEEEEEVFENDKVSDKNVPSLKIPASRMASPRSNLGKNKPFVKPKSNLEKPKPALTADKKGKNPTSKLRSATTRLLKKPTTIPSPSSSAVSSNNDLSGGQREGAGGEKRATINRGTGRSQKGIQKLKPVKIPQVPQKGDKPKEENKSGGFQSKMMTKTSLNKTSANLNSSAVEKQKPDQSSASKSDKPAKKTSKLFGFKRLAGVRSSLKSSLSSSKNDKTSSKKNLPSKPSFEEVDKVEEIVLNSPEPLAVNGSMNLSQPFNDSKVSLPYNNHEHISLPKPTGFNITGVNEHFDDTDHNESVFEEKQNEELKLENIEDVKSNEIHRPRNIEFKNTIITTNLSPLHAKKALIPKSSLVSSLVMGNLATNFENKQFGNPKPTPSSFPTNASAQLLMGVLKSSIKRLVINLHSKIKYIDF